jgi:ABC-type branched-subunit amino acid transport system substrate-binding protein
MSLKRVCASVTLAVAALSGVPAVLAQDARDAFVIGGVLPLSGPYASLGIAMRKGAELAIEERGKVLGKPVRALWEDTETKPQISVQKANKLIAGGAAMLFGDGASIQTLAIMPVAAQRKVPLLVTGSASDAITGASRNAFTFRTSSLIHAETALVTEFVKKQKMKGIYVVAVDQQQGRAAAETMKTNMAAIGVKVLGVDFTPIGSQDYSLVIDKVAKSGAEGVLVVTAGADSSTFLKQAGQVNLGSKVRIFGVGFDDNDAMAVGKDIVGVNSVARYHFSYDTPANKKFVEAYRKKYNEFPDSMAGNAYDGVKWFLEVVDKTGKWDSEVWVKAFEGSSPSSSVFGPRQMRACDHQAVGVGLWTEGVANKAPMPAFSFKVTDSYPPTGLYPDCPK